MSRFLLNLMHQFTLKFVTLVCIMFYHFKLHTGTRIKGFNLVYMIRVTNVDMDRQLLHPVHFSVVNDIPLQQT